MKSMKKNYIAGEWLGSDETIENINPSDISDVIGSYAQADVCLLYTSDAADDQ